MYDKITVSYKELVMSFSSILLVAIFIFAILTIKKCIWAIKNPEKANALVEQYKQQQLEEKRNQPVISENEKLAQKRHQDLLFAIYSSGFYNHNKDN